MKPRIFIGSSVEGINVAYAIHQNLDHDAEVTVWDQGVFELSKTTIESLIDILDIVDFGIFVFSPDDELIMRGDETASIRDNVLFEAGLFIGKLGRERVFFIIPDKIKIQIPSDLLGVKPGKYNPNREDNSLQSATGVFCNQIRNQIDRLGLLRPHDKNEEAERSDDGKDESSEEWFDDLVDINMNPQKRNLRML